jgi:hypothetical protein
MAAYEAQTLIQKFLALRASRLHTLLDFAVDFAADRAPILKRMRGRLEAGDFMAFS